MAGERGTIVVRLAVTSMTTEALEREATAANMSAEPWTAEALVRQEQVAGELERRYAQERRAGKASGWVVVMLSAVSLGLLVAPIIAAQAYAERMAASAVQALRAQVIDYRDYSVRLESDLEQLTSYRRDDAVYFVVGSKCFAGLYREGQLIGRSDVELHASFCGNVTR